MRATGINHVSISAVDLEESTRFYETLFGMERIATPAFATPVQWLRVGDLQLHLFLEESGTPPVRHHLGLTIDDFDTAYDAVSSQASAEWGAELVELPSGQVQLYFRDPSGYVIELTTRQPNHERAMDPATNHARTKLDRWQAAKKATAGK